MHGQTIAQGPDRLSSRFILIERWLGGGAMDLAVYAPHCEPVTARDAAAIIFAFALGQTDDTFVPAERHDPRATCDMFVPPLAFPLICLPHQDGDPRPETIAAVLACCEYVATLRPTPTVA